jgi:signal peptidase I
MKKLILLVLASTAIVMTNCTPAAPITPSPAAPAPVAPTTSMTATEAMLVGDWIFDKQESYSGGSLTGIITTSTAINSVGAITTYTVYAGAHMVFKSSFFNNTVNPPVAPQYYNADYFNSLGLGNFSAFWQVRPTASGETLFHGGAQPFSSTGTATPYILTLNATTLVYQDWIPGTIPNGYKLYYHK